MCKDQSRTSVDASGAAAGRTRVCGTELCAVRRRCWLSGSDMHSSAPANKNNYDRYLNLGTVAWLFCFWDCFTNLAGNSYKKKIIILPLKKRLLNNISLVNRDYFCNKAISVDVVIMG